MASRLTKLNVCMLAFWTNANQSAHKDLRLNSLNKEAGRDKETARGVNRIENGGLCEKEGHQRGCRPSIHPWFWSNKRKHWYSTHSIWHLPKKTWLRPWRQQRLPSCGGLILYLDVVHPIQPHPRIRKCLCLSIPVCLSVCLSVCMYVSLVHSGNLTY